MSGTTTVVLYRFQLSDQGCKRFLGDWGEPAETRLPSLFRRLAWDVQDRRSATLR